MNETQKLFEMGP